MKQELISAILDWVESAPPTIGYYQLEAELISIKETETAIEFTVRLHKTELKKKSRR
jgi:hypothetical protein